MKLAVVGSRSFDDYMLMNEVICSYFLDHCLTPLKTVISGGAKGADSLSKRWAMIMSSEGIEYVEYPAEWDKYGKSAGFRRNKLIVDNCDVVLAFWDGKSRGTAHTIELAKKAKKPTFIIYF